MARTRDGIRGWTAFGACRDSPPADKTGEIWAIYVSPTSWHAGIGRVLMGDALNRLKAADYRSVALWVMAKNERAIRFYDSLGFKREVGSEREFELGGSWIAEARLSIDL